VTFVGNSVGVRGESDVYPRHREAKLFIFIQRIFQAQYAVVFHYMLWI